MRILAKDRMSPRQVYRIKFMYGAAISLLAIAMVVEHVIVPGVATDWCTVKKPDNYAEGALRSI